MSETADLTDVRTVEITDRTHVDGEVDYGDFPPLGGPHAPTWVNCGFYRQEVPPEFAVHSMEHGAVWITYPPDLPPTDVEILQQLTVGQSHLLITESPDVTTLTLTAWGAQLLVDDAQAPSVDEFLVTYVQGEQTPEPGAPCSQGVGEPQA